MQTSLGPALEPLSVVVSLVVPRLVSGAIYNPNAMLSDPAGQREEAFIPGVGGDGTALRFPLTQVGQAQEIFIQVRNPADVTVGLQLAAAEAESIAWTPPQGHSGQSSGSIASRTGDGMVVSQSTSPANPNPKQGQKTRDGAFAAFHVRLAGLAPVILAPGGTAVIGPVRFAPAREGTFAAHVYLRNNLTHLEPVLLEGQAGNGLLSVRALRDGFGHGVPGGGGEAAGDGLRQLGDEGDEESENTVRMFEVDIRSWVRSPPATEPVVKRWVLSNDGTMPLVVHSVGIRKYDAWNELLRGVGIGIGNRLWRYIFGGSRQSASVMFSGAVAGTTVTVTATTTAGALCADGGFRVTSGPCQGSDRWREQTLEPGQELEVAVDFSATHCSPVWRDLDIVTSAGNASILMRAAASGGPSATAACNSARSAAAAARKGKFFDWVIGERGGRLAGADGTDGRNGGQGDDGRWRRAWLLIKIGLLFASVYGGCAVLRAGPELPRVATWARRLAQAPHETEVSSTGCEVIEVSVGVGVHPAGAAVVSSPTASSSSSSCGTPQSSGALSSSGGDRGGPSKLAVGRPQRANHKGAKGGGGKGSEHDDATKKRGGSRNGRRGASSNQARAPSSVTTTEKGSIAETGDVAGAACKSPVISSPDGTAGAKGYEDVAAAAVVDVPRAGGEVVRSSGSPVHGRSSAPVEILTSPGRSSKPTHHRSRSSSSLPSDRPSSDQRPLPTAAHRTTAHAQTAFRADSTGKRGTRLIASGKLSGPQPTSHPNHRPAAAAKRVDRGTRSPAGRHDANEFSAPASLRRNGLAPPPGLTPAGNYSYGRGNNAFGGLQQRQAAHSRGAPHPPSHGSFRSSSAAAGAAVGKHSPARFERGVSSSSSTSSSPNVDSPSPPALASPAASVIASPDGYQDGQRQLFGRPGARQLHGQGACGAGLTGRAGEFLLGGLGKDGAGQHQLAPKAGLPSGRWGSGSGNGSANGAGPFPHQGAFPPLASANSTAGLGASGSRAQPFQRPTSGSGAGGVVPTSLHGSPPYGPIGSNRIMRSVGGSIGVIGGGDGGDRPRQTPLAPASAIRRPPPGLALLPPRLNGGSVYRSGAINALRPASISCSSSSLSVAPIAETADVEWSENLGAFATASAVAAGVLGGDDSKSDFFNEAAGTGDGMGLDGGWGALPTGHDGFADYPRTGRALSAPVESLRQTSPPLSCGVAPIFNASPFLTSGDMVDTTNSSVGVFSSGGAGGNASNTVAQLQQHQHYQQKHQQQTGMGPSSSAAIGAPVGSVVARANAGGSRLGYYMSTAGGACGSSVGWDSVRGGGGGSMIGPSGAVGLSGRDGMPDVVDGTMQSLQDAPVFLGMLPGCSSLDSSSVGSTSGSNNHDGFFGFMGDDGECGDDKEDPTA